MQFCIHYGVVLALHFPGRKRFPSLFSPSLTPLSKSFTEREREQEKKMSKKKALSTMSLKDFHGGSIPSDLALPSAPGVLLGSDSDRNMSANWGNNFGRSDFRPRPKSSSAAGNIDHKASFLAHPAPIGRNFDEEERKPLNGGFALHQSTNDVNVRTLSPIHQDIKPENVSSVRVSDRSMSSPSLVTSPYPLRVEGGNLNGVTTPSSNNDQRINTQPTAWGVREEVIAAEETTKPSLLSGPDALSKISQASALEKVSSGMWQSKKPTQLLPHVLYSRDNSSNAFSVVDVISERTNYDASQGSQVERDPEAEDFKVGGRETSFHSQAPPPEISEWPKLGLFPRSEPLGTSENECRQPLSTSNQLYKNTDYLKVGPSAAEGTSQIVERPKLKLKPRSQPLDQSHGRLEKDRGSLFGSARPRELVLKERGIDEIPISNPNLGNELSRINISKNEATSERLTPTQHNQNTVNLANGKRIRKNLESREPQMGQGKDDNQGRNKWIENRWSSRDAEKQQQDRRPEPDTWRKPIEEEKLAPNNDSGIHHGKIVSSVDLARAFSKSVSDTTHKQSPTQRGLPGIITRCPFHA